MDVWIIMLAVCFAFNNALAASDDSGNKCKHLKDGYRAFIESFVPEMSYLEARESTCRCLDLQSTGSQ